MESKERSLWQTLEGDRVDPSPKQQGNGDAIGNAKVGVWNGPKAEPRRGLGGDWCLASHEDRERWSRQLPHTGEHRKGKCNIDTASSAV